MKRLQSITTSILLSAAAVMAFAGCASHEEEHSTMKAASTGAYPLTKCVVSGEDLGSTPYVFTHNGQTVKLCCKDCLAKFNQDPAKYMAQLNTAK